MKSVRRAHDQHASRDVAMALLQSGKLQPRYVRRFLREARVTAALEHPNIVPVHEIGLDSAGQPYFTMKLLGGETLHAILKKLEAGDPEYRRRYALPRLLQIFVGACNAVAFAHSRGVVHLDLKPANIQVGGFGEVLVLDWGLAKVLDRPDAMVLPEELRVVHTDGVVRGTPGYMSPEQTRGEYSQLDERTDVYALGIILNQLVTGPMPPALRAVADKARAEKPADRYQTVRDLTREINAFLAGYATAAQQASVATLLWLLIKRQKLATASVALILIIAVAAFIRVAASERTTRAALQRIEQEQAANRKLGLLAAPRVLQQATELGKLYDLDGAQQQIDFALALDSKLSGAWAFQACLQIGRQQFQDALTSLDHAANRPATPVRKPPERLRNLDDLTLKYWLLPAPLTRDQQLQFLTDLVQLPKINNEHRQLVLAQFFLQRNRNPDLAFTGEALKLLNPDSKVELTGDLATLKLTGEKINQLAPLAGLPVVTLDLSGSVVTDITPLRTLFALEELRVVRWPRETFGRFKPLTQLSRIVVSQSNVAALEKELSDKARTPPQVIGE
jgi:hypothetical protein